MRWATATEQHNAGFDVQRSATGDSFTTLAFVAGAGNSQTTSTYQYFDAAPLHTTACGSSTPMAPSATAR